MKIKVSLDKKQTPIEAEEQLYKALRSQRLGDAHKSEDRFIDPAMQDLAILMKTKYKIMYDEMLQEIFRELDDEYGL